MDALTKAIGWGFTAVVLCGILKKDKPEFASVMTVCVCVFIFLLSVSLIQPILDLLNRLEELSGLEDTVIKLALKASGISLISEIGAAVMEEGGTASVAKSVRFIGRICLIYLSVPLINELLSLIEKMTEGL